MGTRAIYSFIEGKDTYHVYKHYDGYPSGAVEAIQNALPHAWILPRFEADEFAAAFVTGNKIATSGNVRLLKSGAWRKIAPGDIEYRYEIRMVKGKLMVKGFEVYCDNENVWTQHEIFNAPLDTFPVATQP